MMKNAYLSEDKNFLHGHALDSMSCESQQNTDRGKTLLALPNLIAENPYPEMIIGQVYPRPSYFCHHIKFWSRVHIDLSKISKITSHLVQHP
jgi:hypothetical protein